MTASTNLVYLFVTLLNFGLLLSWPLLSIITLFKMRGRKLSDVAQAVWVLLVILIPIIGAVAYWIVKPGETVSQL